MKSKGSIGVFDSGYGGLTILSEFRKLLPEYDYIYLGDNARTPYGNRSFDVVYDFTLEAVNYLRNRGCRLVILACNTSSAKALRTIQQQDLPRTDSEFRVLGVIRPSTETIGNLSRSKQIGVLGTEGTIRSDSYGIELQKFFPELHVYQQACPLWVPLIESNKHFSDSGKAIIPEDFTKLVSTRPDIDTVLLACTHYPLISEYLQELAGNTIKIVSQGPLVAEKLRDYLTRNKFMNEQLLKNGKCSFLTTEKAEVFDSSAYNFLSMKVQSEEVSL